MQQLYSTLLCFPSLSYHSQVATYVCTVLCVLYAQEVSGCLRETASYIEANELFMGLDREAGWLD